MCQSFNNELDYIKLQLAGKETYGYIQAFAQHRHNANILIKKIIMNKPLFNSVFLSTLRSCGLFLSEEDNKEYQAQYFMYSLLDNIWIEKVYKPQRENLIQSYIWETSSIMTVSRINEINSKKIGLTAALSTVNQIEAQLNKRSNLFSLFSQSLPQMPLNYCPIQTMKDQLQMSLV